MIMIMLTLWHVNSTNLLYFLRNKLDGDDAFIIQHFNDFCLKSLKNTCIFCRLILPQLIHFALVPIINHYQIKNGGVYEAMRYSLKPCSISILGSWCSLKFNSSQVGGNHNYEISLPRKENDNAVKIIAIWSFTFSFYVLLMWSLH